jgi:Protein of unknown function (DUF3108)
MSSPSSTSSERCLEPGESHSLDRHFAAERNPVVVTVLGREQIELGLGTFSAVVVEMRVRDPERYQGEGVITLHLSDDDCRLPLRIESDVPGLGRTILTLEAETHGEAGHTHASAH